MVWQLPLSFNTDEEDYIREQISHESTRELQQKVREIAKDAVLADYEEDE